MNLIMYSDGLCEPRNPGGVCTYGWVAEYDGKEVAYQRGYITEGAKATNNLSEYTAIIHAIAWVWHREMWTEEILFRTDSQLVIRQLQGEWAVKAESIRPLYERARRGLDRLTRYQLEWVPREQNERADVLSRQAYRAHLQQHGLACVATQL